MTELLLDPNIRIFVHFSIALVIFLISTLRVYLIKLVSREEYIDLKSIQCNQALQRADVLLNNGHLLIHRSFLSRRLFFCHERKGFFTIHEARSSKKEEDSNKGFMKDLRVLAEYCRNNLVSVVPPIIAGTWVHFTFGELVCTKVPFFITEQFKAVLQTGIDVSGLEASWISSSSWYFINHFSFSNIGRIIFASDENDISEPAPPRAVSPLFKETKELVQNSRENLEIYQHKWSLAKGEGEEAEDRKVPETENTYRNEPVSVTARGVGLVAAYSGRRAIFAVSPALRDGLDVSSEGPADIQFEYKLKDSMLLVGYVAPRPGRYSLRVSRFGRSAPGSPFVLTIEEAPPGYRGNFGAKLWYDVPVRPPILSGIVDFITEKLYMDENGQLFRLNKDGTVSSDRYVIKRRKSDVWDNTSEQSSDNADKQTDTSDNFPTISSDVPKPFSIKSSNSTEPSFINDDFLKILTKDNTSLDSYRRLTNNLSKEMNTNSKLLNLLGADYGDSVGNVDARCRIAVPKITISEYEAAEDTLTEHNQSREDQFLSQLESRYSAPRSAKLERVAGDDAVSSEPCDGRGQIGARGQSRTAFPTAHDNNPVCFVSQSGKGFKDWRKYHPSNLAFSLGLSKYPHRNLTGIRLLHDIYRIEESPEERENNRNHRRKGIINKERMLKKYCTDTHIMTPERELDDNNIDTEKIPPKTYNPKRLPTSFSDSNLQTKKNKAKSNLSRKNKKISESFRTLSLPDFNSILSLSVRGLRKAKSCGDKSFRALSSSALSASLKNLFERDQVYHVNKKNQHDKMKSVKEAATLVRIAHYGSGKETKVIETGSTSVDEWKKYWEGGAYKKETEVIKGCHVKVKGIVTKGKELFETPREEIYIENNLSQLSSIHSSPNNGSDRNTEIKEDNKTAFQKAKEMFEGNYTSLKDFREPRYKRKRSVSERFHISSLSKDIYSGVTPNHLGIPNRIPVVASLGSVYRYSPVYPHLSRTPSPENVSPWNDLFLDPSYV